MDHTRLAASAGERNCRLRCVSVLLRRCPLLGEDFMSTRRDSRFFMHRSHRFRLSFTLVDLGCILLDENMGIRQPQPVKRCVGQSNHNPSNSPTPTTPPPNSWEQCATLCAMKADSDISLRTSVAAVRRDECWCGRSRATYMGDLVYSRALPAAARRCNTAYSSLPFTESRPLQLQVPRQRRPAANVRRRPPRQPFRAVLRSPSRRPPCIPSGCSGRPADLHRCVGHRHHRGGGGNLCAHLGPAI